MKVLKCLLSLSCFVLSILCFQYLTTDMHEAKLASVETTTVSSVKLCLSVKTYRVLLYSFFGKNYLHEYTDSIKDVAREADVSFLYGFEDGWQIRIYTDVEIPAIFKKEVRTINPRLLFVNISGNETLLKTNGMVWRFIPMADSSVDIACFRDLDSVIFK